MNDVIKREEVPK